MATAYDTGCDERIDLRSGDMRILIDAEKLEECLECDAEELQADAVTISAAFLLRRRGVETKLMFADARCDPDEVLIKNIAKAHHWYQQIKAGKTMSEIATTAGTSNHRVQQLIELAFLAPDIIKDILAGKQPTGLTSNWFRQHGLPASWQDQRDLLATL